MADLAAEAAAQLQTDRALKAVKNRQVERHREFGRAWELFSACCCPESADSAVGTIRDLARLLGEWGWDHYLVACRDDLQRLWSETDKNTSRLSRWQLLQRLHIVELLLLAVDSADPQRIEQRFQEARPWAHEGFGLADEVDNVRELLDAKNQAELRRIIGPPIAEPAACDYRETASEVPLGDYVYRRNGSTFEVVFENDRGTIPADLDGALYIYWLLQSPNVAMPASQLRTQLAVYKGAERFTARRSTVDTSQDCSETRAVDDPTEEIEYLKSQANQLDRQIKQARDSRDEKAVERYMAELVAVKDSVQKLQGLNGRPRVTIDENARKAVTVAIRLVRKRCDDDWNLRQFSEHLAATIKTGANCAYRPDPAPIWHF